MEQTKHSKHHHSKRSSSAVPVYNFNNQYSDDNYHQSNTSILLSPFSPIQCSAYFIGRRNLNDYRVQTLKQIVDNVVSGPKSKGLKVKLSLPDEGLIIDNTLDPDQSWMYKTSELLYFWRDYYNINIIVVITLNRPDYYAADPYSASIFRLRGHESVQLFIHRAQQFFAHLSTSNISRNNPNTSLEKSATTEDLTISEHRKKHSRKSKHHSTTNQQSVTEHSSSSKTTTVDSVATRTEFTPKKRTTKPDSNFEPYKRQTHNETTISNDTRSSKSKNDDDDDDNKIITTNSYIPGEYVAQLLYELKELRSEIAALKLDARFTPVRSTSTSPLPEFRENITHKVDLVQLENDAGTQTDLSLINDEKNQLVEKMDTSNEIFLANKRKKELSDTKVNKRTVSNNNGSDREESIQVNSSQINVSSNEISSTYTRAEFQPILHPTRSHSKIKTQQNNSIISNSIENESFLPIKPLVIEKEISEVLSTNNSSSVRMNTESSLPINTGEIVSFRTSLENTIDPPENIYENLPIFFQMNSNQDFYYKNDQQNRNKPHLHVTIARDRDSELQKQYLSQLFGPQNGISSLLPKELIQNNMNTYTVTQDIKKNHQQYFQQGLFSNHLTNPLFNVDKQLLANTIANQFGIDSKSPYLEKLISNQHLFVPHKRTFANMVWQITPEEEDALCSSPETTKSNIIDINTIDTNSSTAKSILKPKKSSRSVSKGQRISWDSTLE